MMTSKEGLEKEKNACRDSDGGKRSAAPDKAVLTVPGRQARGRTSRSILLLTGMAGGFVYTIALPMLGLFTVTVLLARRTLDGMYDLAVKSASFGWTPRRAYLSGKRKGV